MKARCALFAMACTTALTVAAQRELEAQETVPPGPVVPSDTLRLRPGDVVRLQVWREPQYSGDFPVDEGGYAVLPMLGRRRVTDLQWGVLRDTLAVQIRRGINSEAINLVPLRRIFVLGAVLRPGIYMLEPAVGVEGAVALAGGAALDGNLEKVRIIRDGQTIARNVSITRSVTQHTLASNDRVFVERRSWLDRNSALLLSSFVSFSAALAALLRGRNGA